MKTVYKYQLEVTDFQSINMPQGAKILNVKVKEGIPWLYAIVDSEEKIIEARPIFTFGTGRPLIGEYDFIDTYQFSGDFVFHVFEGVK